jgi:hypothetical protein
VHFEEPFGIALFWYVVFKPSDWENIMPNWLMWRCRLIWLGQLGFSTNISWEVGGK